MLSGRDRLRRLFDPERRQRSIISVVVLIVVAGSVGLLFSPLVHNWQRDFASRQSSNGGSALTATSAAHKVVFSVSNGSGQTPEVGNGQGSLDWPVGDCTYWANYRYHQLSGHWVSWTGNANQWVSGARDAGWAVSTRPHVPSIIVLMPSVYYAGEFGHVGVVESIVAGTTPTKVHTSNMNWWNNGGGFDMMSFADFTVGQGVYFIWHP